MEISESIFTYWLQRGTVNSGIQRRRKKDFIVLFSKGHYFYPGPGFFI
jgi:hypothetical protein